VWSTEEELLDRYVLEDTGRPIEFRSVARTSIQFSAVATGRGLQARSIHEGNRSTGLWGSIGSRSTGDGEVEVDALQPYSSGMTGSNTLDANLASW